MSGTTPPEPDAPTEPEPEPAPEEPTAAYRVIRRMMTRDELNEAIASVTVGGSSA